MSDAIAVVRALYDAFERRDMPAGLATMAQDIEWRESAGPRTAGVHRGQDAVVQNVFAQALELVPDLRVTPEEVFGAGERVGVVHRYTGIVAATGTPVDIPGIGVWEVRDGKIVAYEQFSDAARWEQALAP
jgi:uncharacterized protein